MATGTLTRYNWRVMMHNNWWLMVFPIAASQVTVYWNIITQRFSPELPAATLEMVSPLLAAFLCAHTLAPEYRSGMGVILASKPMHIGRIVVRRMLAMLGLVWLLALLSLAAYYYGMEHFGILRPILACLPSTLFLALYALTFATLLRHPLAGFGLAALYWALDLPPGPLLHPYLSLRSYSASFPLAGTPAHLPFTDDWWIAKVVLLVGAAALYAVHARLVFTLGSPMTARRGRRALGWAAAVMLIYLVSGASLKVGYGYAHRGALWPDDPVWFRRHLGPYGPVPIAWLFGPAFARYVGDIPNGWRVQWGDESDAYDDTQEHIRKLREVVDRMPNSVWAPGAASLLSRLERRHLKTPEDQAALARLATDRYPTSPYAALGLRDGARIYVDAEMSDRATDTYRELLRRYPSSRYALEAVGYVAVRAKETGNLAEAASLAQRWADGAPIYERFTALALLAEARAGLSDRAGALDAAQRTLEAYDAYQRSRRAPGTRPDRRAPVWDAAADGARQRALAVARRLQHQPWRRRRAPAVRKKAPIEWRNPGKGVRSDPAQELGA